MTVKDLDGNPLWGRRGFDYRLASRLYRMWYRANEKAQGHFCIDEVFFRVEHRWYRANAKAQGHFPQYRRGCELWELPAVLQAMFAELSYVVCDGLYGLYTPADFRFTCGKG